MIKNPGAPGAPATAAAVATLAAAAALAAASFLGGCTRADASAPEPLQGVVEFDQAVLGFEVAGRIARISVVRGQRVAAGAPLATLDDTLARLTRDVRAAELASARAQLALIRGGTRVEDLRAADAELAAARTQEQVARRSLERQNNLVARGAAPPAGLDESSERVARAEAERRAREERLKAMRAGARDEERAAAVARVQAASAALELEEARLLRHALAAPRGGVVLDVHLEAGEVVAPGTPVVTLADVTHPFVDVFVPQARLGGVSLGASAQVRVDAAPAPVPGRVEDIGRQTEFTPRYLFSERERPNLVVRVRVRVDDPAGVLHAGVPAFVTVGSGR